MTDFATRRTMMVDTQVRPSDVTKFNVIEAMLSIPREEFVPRDKREAAYVGENMSIGADRTILEPRTFAKMLDATDVQQSEMVLIIGAGYGYGAAVLSRLAELVVAVEEDEAMLSEAQEAMSENGFDNVVFEGNALDQGAAAHGPYDAIVIEGAVEEIPEAILDQVKEGGRICAVFAEGSLGTVRIGYKLGGEMNWQYAFNAGAPVLTGFKRTMAFSL